MQNPSKAEPIQTKHQTLSKSIMLIAKKNHSCAIQTQEIAAYIKTKRV